MAAIEASLAENLEQMGFSKREVKNLLAGSGKALTAAVRERLRDREVKKPKPKGREVLQCDSANPLLIRHRVALEQDVLHDRVRTSWLSSFARLPVVAELPGHAFIVHQTCLRLRRELVDGGPESVLGTQSFLELDVREDAHMARQVACGLRSRSGTQDRWCLRRDTAGESYGESEFNAHNSFSCGRHSMSARAGRGQWCKSSVRRGQLA